MQAIREDAASGLDVRQLVTEVDSELMAKASRDLGEEEFIGDFESCS